MAVSFCFPLPSPGYRLDDLGFNSWQRQEILLFRMSRLAVGITQSAVEWVPRVKQLVLQADHSLPSGAYAKKWWSSTSISLYIFMKCEGTTLPYLYTQF
jgi:hypothetical protein